MMRFPYTLLILLFVFASSAEARQVVPDTMIVNMEPIIVEAERHSQRLLTATSAISTLELDGSVGPAAGSPTDILSMLPGLGFLSLDGTGYDAQAVVRGFYGGGDAEYVQVLVDGVPINDAEDGLVQWDLIDLHNVSRVEILRGGSSSLYGDAAIGAVMNLRTRPATGRQLSGTVRYGSYASVDAAIRYADVIQNRAFSLSGTFDQSDGYRNNSNREVASLSVGLDLFPTGPVHGKLAISSAVRDVRKPGPLTDSLLAISRTRVLSMFAHDRTDEARHRASLTLRSRPNTALGWMVRARGQVRDARIISTLALAADFADTQDRDLYSRSLALSGQFNATSSIGKVVAGTDVVRSALESTYYSFFTGTQAQYEQSSIFARGDRTVAGDGTRTQLGAFVQAESRRFGPAALTVGARVDQIQDRYTPEGSGEIENTQNAVSPKVGLNVEIIATAVQRANLYLSAGKSFKAPAFDQLFDQRLTPVPFDPFAIAISNGELKPQRGDNFEVGGYSQFVIPGRGRAELAISAYRMDMRDELDFSFAEFRLVNIGKSRHDGVEFGAKYADRSGFSGHMSYAQQATTFRNGDNKGKYVKAVPRDLIDVGAVFEHASGVSASVSYTGARRIFLDDQNTRRLDNIDRFDVGAGMQLAGVRVELQVFNVFDADDVATGFPDPAGGSTQFLYPSAERHFRLGLVYRR